MMPKTQEPSHGAGHTRPVNSGKLFVSRRRSNASRHLFWYTNSLNSGILFPRGHPEFSCNFKQMHLFFSLPVAPNRVLDEKFHPSGKAHLMTERSTTVHATGWLCLQKWARLPFLHDFFPIIHSNVRVTVLNTLTLISNKTSMLDSISNLMGSLGCLRLFNQQKNFKEISQLKMYHYKIMVSSKSVTSCICDNSKLAYSRC